MQLLLYHLQLAARGLRRDVGLSSAIAVGMCLATSLFAVAVLHTFRLYGPRPALDPSLHQVELVHPGAYTALRAGSAWTGPLSVRTRVTPREHAVLTGSGLAAREISTFRARLQVARPRETPEIAMVRFVDPDFFALFDRAFAAGAPWSARENAAAEPVAVLSMLRARRHFGPRDPRGEVILIDGVPHRIVGSLAQHQPLWVEWDLSAFGLDQDAVYLPYPRTRKLLARPDMAVFQSAVGPRYDQLLASDAVFIAHWIALPSAQERDAYVRYLDQRLGRGQYVLRDLATWRAATALPETGATFFTTLTFILLLGGGFNMMRLLLAKNLARVEEIGIHRALGAPRGAIFTRAMLEALLLVLPAAVLGALLAWPYVVLWNRAVADTDIPLTMSSLASSAATLVSLLVGLTAALYPSWRLAGIKPAISVMRR